VNVVGDGDWRDRPVPTLRGTTWGQLRDEFVRFCAELTIPSKELGMIRLRLISSQVYLLDQVFRWMAAGFHDFVILKARQLGVSTLLWALDLFWMMRFGGMQGLYIADSDPNKELHRDTVSEMLASIPPRLRRAVRVNNRLQLAFKHAPGYLGSRLMFSAANLKNKGQLGRSRGVNYGHFEELDSWEDADALSALNAALATEHPMRLYLWVGTGQGYGELFKMWNQAEGSVASKPLFIGWWQLDTRVITRAQRAVWEAYGAAPPSQDEAEWMAEVARRFAATISPEQLAWWRFTKAEGKGINGEEAKTLQEYPWLPEQAFQASGSQFVSATTSLRLRTALSRAPVPVGYRYDWGLTFDERDDVLTEVPLEEATLVVWEQPNPGGLYITAGDPAYGSSTKADAFAVTIWRAFPDQLVQVATYRSQIGTMYQFAWVLAHLAANYGRWLIYDVNGPGVAVMQEMKRLKDRGLGLTRRHGSLHDVVGAVEEYLWSRPDVLSPTFNRQWKTGPSTQEPLMEQLRDTVERGALVIRDRDLVSEVVALRRDGGRIEPSAGLHDDLAVTAAMAVEYWLNTVMEEVEAVVAPRTAAKEAAPAAERLLRSFLREMRTKDEAHDALEIPRPYGVRPGGPGR